MILSHSMLLGVNKHIYMDAVIADGAAYAWDFHDQPAGTSTAIVGGVPMQMVNGIVSASEFNDVAKSVKINGTNQYFWANSNIFPNTNVSLEFLLRTSSTSGNIFSGVNGVPTSANIHDKHIAFDTSGKLSFGIWSGSARIFITNLNISDNIFHHIVLALSTNNTRLIVDGVNVYDLAYKSTDTATIPAFAYPLNPWQGLTGNALNGEIACPSIYNFVMTPQMANIHYMLSKQ